MKKKEFAIFNNISEKEADQILDWFLENFNEKDIEKVADILCVTVVKSAATIHNLRNACIEIKKINFDYNDLKIVEDLGRMANYGFNSADAGRNIGLIIKKVKS